MGFSPLTLWVNIFGAGSGGFRLMQFYFNLYDQNM
jgi:hypothetical protein